MEKPTRDAVRVEVWEERDRLHIGIQDKKTGEYYKSWWDDEAREMFEDGFFQRGPRLEESVLSYAEERGILAKQRGESGTYWWVRLGDVAEYEKFDTRNEAKEYVEEKTGSRLDKAEWINPYGFVLGPFKAGNYISFFEGDEDAQPTEKHLWGKD